MVEATNWACKMCGYKHNPAQANACKMGCNKGDIKPFVMGGDWRCTACTFSHNPDTKLKCKMGCKGNTRPADSLF